MKIMDTTTQSPPSPFHLSHTSYHSYLSHSSVLHPHVPGPLPPSPSPRPLPSPVTMASLAPPPAASSSNTGTIIVQPPPPSGTRESRIATHSHIKGLGLADDGSAMPASQGFVGQRMAREALGLHLALLRLGRHSGRPLLLVGPPGTGKVSGGQSGRYGSGRKLNLDRRQWRWQCRRSWGRKCRSARWSGQRCIRGR